MIDDGSRDCTANVAKRCGVSTRASACTRGSRRVHDRLDASLKAGADFIINTDADNQYAADDIPRLLAPLLSGEADIVIGDRNIGVLRHMSWRKRQLQQLGSWVVRQVSNTNVPDTTSGFRAYTREAALRMTIISEFSYTLESIIQAGKKRMAIAHVPIATNRARVNRGSSTASSPISNARAATIVRIYAITSPSRSSPTWPRGLRRRFRRRDAVRVLLFQGGVQAPGVAHRLRGADDRRLPGSCHRFAGRRHLGQPQIARRSSVPGPIARASARPGSGCPSGTLHQRPVGAPVVADPSAVSIVIPAYNEADVIAEVVGELAAGGPWHQIIVVDDGSRDGTAARAAEAGATVVRHPYNKGNGAAVKSGIRAATGEFVLIVDGDGQHRPEDARRLASRLGEYDLVIGAKSPSRSDSSPSGERNAELARG